MPSPYPTVRPRSAVRVTEAPAPAPALDPLPPPNTLHFGGQGAVGGNRPPDTAGAVDATWMFEATNQYVWAYQRSSTDDHLFMSLTDFFTANVNPPDPMPSVVAAFDPVVIRDPLSGYYFAVALNQLSTGYPGIFFGSTQTTDPTGDWQYGFIPCDQTQWPNGWFDYPNIGTSDAFFVISVNVFNASGSFIGTATYVVDKPSYLASGTADTVLFTGDSSEGATFVPALGHTSGDPMYIVQVGGGASWNGSSWVNTAEVTGSFANEDIDLANGAFYSSDTFFGAPGNPYVGPQAGTSARLDVGDTRMMRAVTRNGVTWMVHTVFKDTTSGALVSGVRYWAVAIAMDVGAQGDLWDSSGSTWYSYPSIAVNSGYDALIGMAAFSATKFPGAAYTGRAANDPVGALRTPYVYDNGLSYYNFPTANAAGSRWGDYSATVVDPADDESFWTLQETATGPTTWSTRWAQVPALS